VKNLLLVLFLFSIKLFSFQGLSSNALGFLIVGDINVGYETSINDFTSWVSTGHYITSTAKIFETEMEYRLSTGIRFYSKKINELNKNDFLEFKFGTFQGSNNASTTGEIYYGFRDQFNKFIYHEIKFGLARVLNNSSSQFFPSGAINIGFQLN